jgi:hypothetical protein
LFPRNAKQQHEESLDASATDLSCHHLSSQPAGEDHGMAEAPFEQRKPCSYMGFRVCIDFVAKEGISLEPGNHVLIWDSVYVLILSLKRESRSYLGFRLLCDFAGKQGISFLSGIPIIM